MSSLEQRVRWYLTTAFAECIVQLCVSAIQVFMWLYMASFYIEASPETRKRRLPYLIASLVILVLHCVSGVLFGLQVYKTLFEIVPGPENLEAMVETIVRFQDNLYGVRALLGDWAYRVGDFVLLYRCYIFWSDRRWIILLPASVFLAGIGINLRRYIPLSFYDTKLNSADSLLLVATNIILTLLISVRLIRAQRQLALVMPNTDHKLYLGVVTILVESAAPVAVLGVAVSVANLITSDEAYKAYLSLAPLFSTAAALAPQLIIFRVNTGTSWAHKSDTSAMLSRPIEFNGHAQDRCDEESGFDETSER